MIRGGLFDCSIVSATNPNCEIIEELIVGSGRPLILLPAETTFKYSPKVAFVAWMEADPPRAPFTIQFQFYSRRLTIWSQTCEQNV